MRPRPSILSCLLVLILSIAAQSQPSNSAAAAHTVKVGNYLVGEPYGIAIIVDDATAFVMAPAWEGPSRKTKYAEVDAALFPPGITAPDFSFSQVSFPCRDAQVRFTWGRAAKDAVIGTVETDRPVAFRLRFPAVTWPQFHAIYSARADGVEGTGIEPRGKFIPFRLRVDPAPALVRANFTAEAEIVLRLDPQHPARFVAGIGALPAFDSVQPTLAAAAARYAESRMTASGDWGDFLSPIADNVNNTRLYGSDNGRILVADGRGWWLQHLKGVDGNADLFPYFEWDSFFNALLASFEDVQTAHDTVRAVLSFQTPDGRLPSFSHWGNEGNTYLTLHRSMVAVGALCVWKIHERRPDLAFLAEVYPKLVRSHEWWPKARDGNHNGLLEWGSEQHWWQGAQYETGWDDNVEYIGTLMAGNAMNADAVDLSSMWSVDAEYLARIARALGKTADAARFQAEHDAMNRRINQRLWNDELGIYCSRLWSIPPVEGPELQQAFLAGFEATYYRDLALNEVGEKRHEDRIDFDWREAAPVPTLSSDNWSAQFSGNFVPPQSGSYRFLIAGGDNVRLSVAGKPVENWWYDAQDRRLVDLQLEGGKQYPVQLTYFHAAGRARLQMSVFPLAPGKPGSDWLTRLTPMNFYPLIAGAADKDRAAKTLNWLYREDKFWLDWVVPTVAKDDPVFPEQTYWHGHVWPPNNYLLWLGLQRYADAGHQAEFVRRSVELFMRNWRTQRLNCENYKSTDGTCGDDPHYTWGLLLNLIGMEALAGVGPDFHPVPGDNAAITEHVVMRRVPFGGKLYRIEAAQGKVTVTPEP